MPTPFTAAALSALLPGAGQWANGERVKAGALWAMVAGIAGSIWLALAGPAAVRSHVSALLLSAIYLFVVGPAVSDAHQVASGRGAQSLLSGTRRWYVIVMLFTVGPMALPFLWQSSGFSRRAKWLWTAAIFAIAALSLWFVLAVGPLIERLLRSAA